MTSVRTIDGAGSNEMYKIYCDCGRIVSLDRSSVKMKKNLKKSVECTVCRNQRISVDIEYLNDLYNGTLDEGSEA